MMYSTTVRLLYFSIVRTILRLNTAAEKDCVILILLGYHVCLLETIPAIILYFSLERTGFISRNR